MIPGLLLRSAAVLAIFATTAYTALLMREQMRPLDAGVTLGACDWKEPCAVTRVRPNAEGVQAGDRVLAVDGAPVWVEAFDSHQTAFVSSRAGVPHVLELDRSGSIITARVTPQRTERRMGGTRLWVVWPAKWLAIAVGSLLLWTRTRSLVGWLAGGLLLCAALGSHVPILQPGAGGAAREFGPVIGGLIVIGAAAVHAMSGVVFPVLWIAFPAWPPALRPRWLVALLASAAWIPLGIAEVVMVTGAWLGTDVPIPDVGRFAPVSAAIVVAIGTAAMAYNYRISTGDARRRLRAIAFTLVIIFTLWAFHAVVLALRQGPLIQISRVGLAATAILLPIVLGWAVLRHRAFGVRFYVRRIVRYTLARGTLLALIIAPALALAYFAGREGTATLTGRPWLVAALAGAAALAAAREPLLVWIDRRLWLGNSSAERILLRLSGELRTAGTLPHVVEVVRRTLHAAYHPRLLEVELHRDESDAAGAALSHWQRLSLPTDLLFGLAGGQPVQISGSAAGAFGEQEIWLTPVLRDDRRLLGFVITGERASGEPYDEDDRGLLAGIAHAAAAQVAAVELAESVLAERAARAELAARFEQERDHLARELHDGIGSTLARISVVADRAAADASERAAELARGGITELRQMLWASDAAEDGWPETAAHLRRLALETVGAAGIRATMNVSDATGGTAGPLRPAQRLAVLRALQQALANVIAHAQATAVQIHLERTSVHVRLTVEDNGRGFDPAQVPGRREGHYGLESLARRAAELGGGLTIDSRPGAGARLIFEVPSHA